MNDSTHTTHTKPAPANRHPSRLEADKKPYSSPQLIEYGGLVDLTGGGTGRRRDSTGGRQPG